MVEPFSKIDEDEDEHGANDRQFRHLVSIWRALAYASEKPARYLKGRGIKFVPPSARLLPATQMKQLAGYDFPAMVLPVMNGEVLLGAHITFLDRNGTTKAALEKPRRMYGQIKGGFIQLSMIDHDQPLIIGEGVESTLSAMQLAGNPGIAAMSASFMSSVRPPPCREIIIAADNDENESGLKAAAALAERLQFEGHQVRIAMPPRRAEEKSRDWNDALRDGSGVHAWQAAFSNGAAKIKHKPIFALTEEEFMALTFPKRDLLLDPWLPRASLVMVHAPRGEGKTWFVMAVGKAVAAKTDFLGWSCQNFGRVLYIDGELPGEFMQKRLGMFEKSPPGTFNVLCRDNYQLRQQLMPDLGEEAGRNEIDRIVDQCRAEVVILDSISTLIRSGIENEADDWAPIQDWLMRHRWQGRTILLVHHEGRSGHPRGTSKREDVLDTMIRLRKQSDEDVNGKGDAESVFRLDFTKHRDFFGKDAAPMLLHLSTSEGRATWKHELERDAQRDKVKELLDAGMKQKDIAKELNVTPGRVSQLVKTVKAEGRVIKFPKNASGYRDED